MKGEDDGDEGASVYIPPFFVQINNYTTTKPYHHYMCAQIFTVKGKGNLDLELKSLYFLLPIIQRATRALFTFLSGLVSIQPTRGYEFMGSLTDSQSTMAEAILGFWMREQERALGAFSYFNINSSQLSSKAQIKEPFSDPVMMFPNERIVCIGYGTGIDRNFSTKNLTSHHFRSFAFPQ